MKMSLPNLLHKTAFLKFCYVFFFTLSLSIGEAQTLTEPSRIMLNPLENAVGGMAVTWRCPVDVIHSKIEYMEVTAHPVYDQDLDESRVETDHSDISEIEAQSRLDTVPYQGKTGVYKSFRTSLVNLEAGMKYMYRVGSDEYGWSEWIQFQMPSGEADDKLTFIYLGDPQEDLHNQWSRTIREAYSDAPKSAFVLYAGDIGNTAFNDKEWGDLHSAAGFIHRMIPSIMTPGNHDYAYPILDPLWKTHLTLPNNGPKGYENLEGACYYIDYPAVRVISLDGTTIEKNPDLEKVQAEWLESVLKETDNKWIILTIHQPFYSTKESRDNPMIRRSFKPLVDKYGVDMVLQGHDHAFGRGMLAKGENVETPGDAGTMYMVSVSGPKMYELGTNKSWMQSQNENIQMYHVIDIEGDQLECRSYTTTGALFDSFELHKTEKRSIRLVE